MWESGPALGLRAADAAEARRRLPPNLLQAAGPHLQDCAAAAVEQARADERDATGRRPAWALWKGELGRLERPVRPVETEEEPVAEEFLGDRARLVWGPYPPWVRTCTHCQLASLALESRSQSGWPSLSVCQ